MSTSAPKHFAPSKGKTLSESFISACRGGQVNRARSYLEQGADINTRDDDNATGLYHAVRAENAPLVRLLLTNKADVTLANNQGQTLLHVSPAEFVDALVDAGADINARDVDGKTPINTVRHIWIEEHRVNKLLDRNARVDISDNEGKTISDILSRTIAAARNTSIAEQQQLARYKTLAARLSSLGG